MSENLSSYPFASARAMALGSKLITNEKLTRLIEAKDFETALRQLSEFGYGQPATEFDAMIQKELDGADELLFKLSPSEVFTRIVLSERDYLNLKMLLKLRLRNQPLDSVLLNPGNISLEVLQRAVLESHHVDLPDHMKEALQYIDRQLAITADASVIGVALDRAYAKEICDLVAQLKNELVTEYFTKYFDLSNIIAMLRVRASGMPKEMFERAFLTGGRIEKHTLLEAFDMPNESVLKAAGRGGYTAILTDAFEDYLKTGSLYMLEKKRDDTLLSLLKEQRYDMFGIGPLFGYYIAKQREAAAVRMVMTAKQGGIDADVVAKRLKELY